MAHIPMVEYGPYLSVLSGKMQKSIPDKGDIRGMTNWVGAGAET